MKVNDEYLLDKFGLKFFKIYIAGAFLVMPFLLLAFALWIAYISYSQDYRVALFSLSAGFFQLFILLKVYFSYKKRIGQKNHN